MYKHLPKSSLFWYSCFLLWFVTLWWLSSSTRDMPKGLDIPLKDKVLHFGYFFGGAGLFSAALYLSLKKPTNWIILISLNLIVLGATGALDEWHQSQVPGRYGNDLADWTADILGTLVGALVFKRLHFLFDASKPSTN